MPRRQRRLLPVVALAGIPSSVRLAAPVAAALGALYLWWRPPTPDLAAQVARATAARRSGVATWWTGWFGGVSRSNYSVLVPGGMAWLGVAAVACLSLIVGGLGCAALIRHAPRPRAGTVAFCLANFADVLNGRVTFEVGVAFGVCALLAVQRRRPGWGVVASLATYLASPLAGLFVGITCVAVAVADRPRRRDALASAAALAVLAAVMALLFGNAGTMTFSLGAAASAACGLVAVLICCPSRMIRVAVGLFALAGVAFWAVPNAVGDNITRLSWIAAAPLVVSYAVLPRLRLFAAVVLAAWWPALDVAGQLASAYQPSSQRAFYAPLADALHEQQRQLGAVGVGERVEVVDTINHWGSAYLTDFSLARGWDRQADRAGNPVFYTPGALSPASYRRWLSQLAVGWVALPDAKVDYAARDEARLIRAGVSDLTEVWHDRDWRLFRVTDATPLVSGAAVAAVTSDGVLLAAHPAGQSLIRLRFSPYLTLVDPVTDRAVPGCVFDDHGWTGVVLPAGGPVRLVARFAPESVPAPWDADDPACHPHP